MVNQPLKPKDNLLITIANEAIARIEKKIAAIQAIIDDDPLTEIMELDAKLSDCVNQYSACKTQKEIDSLVQRQNNILKKRSECYIRFKKQKDLLKLFDKRNKLEREKRLYESAKIHFNFIQL